MALLLPLLFLAAASGGSAQRTTEPRMPERFSVSFYVSDTETDPLDSTG